MENVQAQQAYEYVSTGQWTQSQFEEWVDSVKECAFSQGQENVQEAFAFSC